MMAFSKHSRAGHMVFIYYPNWRYLCISHCTGYPWGIAGCQAVSCIQPGTEASNRSRFDVQKMRWRIRHRGEAW